MPKRLKRPNTYIFVSFQGHPENLNDCKKIKHLWTQNVVLRKGLPGFKCENRKKKLTFCIKRLRGVGVVPPRSCWPCVINFNL